MARVFTINFCFKGKGYSAIVSFKEQGQDLNFLVRYPDEDLRTIVPEGKVIVSLAEGIKSPSPVPVLAEALIFQTTEAIASHLHLNDI